MERERTKFQLGESVSFMEVIFTKADEVLQGQKLLKSSFITNVHLSIGDKSLELET